MTLEEKIQNDLKEAMKAKDAVRLNTVRSIKSAILLAKTAEGGDGTIDDSQILKLIGKLSKQRRESASQYSAAGREDMAQAELQEAAILDSYLPKQLSEAQIEEKVKEIIAQVGATSASQMGKVMGIATKALQGLASGQAISAAAKKLLS